MIDKLKEIFQSKKVTAASPQGGKEVELPENILRKQLLKLTLVVAIAAASIFVVITLVLANNKKKTKEAVEAEDKKSGKVKIELASKALDPEKMWRNHFEDKLAENSNKVEERLQLIEESFSQKEEQLAEKSKKELKDMQEQLKFAKEELSSAIAQLKESMELVNKKESNNDKREEFGDSGSNISSYQIETENNIGAAKSSRNYIPETAYVQGVLLGGASVSTGISSSSEPVPVVIRITGRGNMPKSFALDLKTCRVLASSYGDLSSQRAVIRAEVLSCHDEAKEEIVTTNIAGVVFGDDGMQGVKGRVVQTSNKHMQNAVIGGLLSGFASTAKSAEQFNITSLGAVSSKKTNFGDRLKDNSLSGIGGAGEKIADYYLRQAEAMSPVLQIPGGTKVDIVFTKGVYLGSRNVKERLEVERRKTTAANQGG